MTSFIDIAMVGTYLVVMLLVGFFVSRKADVEGYFVNNRRTKTLLLMTTTISTSVGAGVVIATASFTYQHGIGIGVALCIAAFSGWLVAAFLSKRIKSFGDSRKAFTIGDFFGERYSRWARITAASFLAIIAFIWTAVQFVAIGNMMSVLTGLNFSIALFLAAGVTIIYVALGGIKSDFYTDAIQFWIMLLIFVTLIPLGLSHIGGANALDSLPKSHFDLFSFGGPLFFFGIIFFFTFYSLTSMDVWQRIYSATNRATAKKALLLAAAITPLFYIAATILGLISAVAFKGMGVAGDMAVFKLMDATLPVGLLGIGMISLLAIVMSTIDSQIVMLSAIFTKDFYKESLKPAATSKEMLKLGRLVGFFGGIVALTIAYLLPDIVQLAIYGTTVVLIFTPAVIGGFFWKRATAKAAVWSIITGFASAAVLIAILGENGAIPAIIVSTVTFVALSYLTKHSPTENFQTG